MRILRFLKDRASHRSRRVGVGFMIQSGSGVERVILGMGYRGKTGMVSGVLYPVLFELFDESTCTNGTSESRVIGPRTDLVIDPADWSGCFCQEGEPTASLIRAAA